MFRDLGEVSFRVLDGDSSESPDGSGAKAPPVAAAPVPRQGDTLPAGPTGAGSIAVGSSVKVNIETAGDHDWYAVTLTAGVTYTIHTTFDETYTDAYLAIRSASGAILEADDDSGEQNNSLISFTPLTSGTYYIDTSTWDGLTYGTYYLSVAQALPGGADSVGNTIATASSIAVDGSRNGNIETAGDRDVYAVTLQAGQTYLIRTGAVTLSTETDTVLTLRDAGGNAIKSNDDIGEQAFSGIRYTPTSSGTYLGPGITKVKLTVIAPPKHIETQKDLFAIQVGAFRDRSRAVALQEEMQRRFGSARLVERGGEPPMYRVLAGEYQSESAAEAIAAEIRFGGGAGLVVRLDESRQ